MGQCSSITTTLPTLKYYLSFSSLKQIEMNEVLLFAIVLGLVPIIGAMSLVAQLASPSVSNGNVQDSNLPSHIVTTELWGNKFLLLDYL